MRILFIKRLSALALAMALIAVTTHASDVVKRVVFPKGKNTVTFKAKLPSEYATYHAYVLKARKGQRITVKLTSDDADASFSIFETKQLGPDEDMLFGNEPETRQWSGLAPLTSEYAVQIYGVKDIDDKPSGSGYSVEITLLN